MLLISAAGVVTAPPSPYPAIFSTAAALSTFLSSAVVPTGQMVAIAVLNTGFDVGQTPSAQDVTAMGTIGATVFSGLTYQQSYAIIGVKGQSSATESKVTNGATAYLTRRVGSVGSGFTVVARSAAFPYGNAAYIQVVPDQITITAGTQVSFAITARDQYGNLQNQAGASPFLVSFSPALVGGAAASAPPRDGTYTYTWSSTKAQQYTQYVTVNGGLGGSVAYQATPSSSKLFGFSVSVIAGL